mmetsp:Transcript_2352/g.4381  ORF Transcript_2352/g.4381 Transcript_2352/m.4381 type:complete len:88 (+) Transcript_2352:105-368(+)
MMLYYHMSNFLCTEVKKSGGHRWYNTLYFIRCSLNSFLVPHFDSFASLFETNSLFYSIQNETIRHSRSSNRSGGSTGECQLGGTTRD